MRATIKTPAAAFCFHYCKGMQEPDGLHTSHWFLYPGLKCLGLGGNIDLHDDCFGLARGSIYPWSFLLVKLRKTLEENGMGWQVFFF